MSPDRFIRTETNVYYLKFLQTPTNVVPDPEPAHHIFVIDRSGSMWGDIEGVKSSLEQAIAVESYGNGKVLTTLISFSTHGDVTLHWAKVPAEDVTKLDKPYIKKLREIRATSLTGMSQALNLALTQVDLNQTTGVTLFTDGYANSPSSYAEIQNLDAFVRKASEAPALFLNCIGYRDWCDWPRMASMSNALSGKTIKASSFKDVLDAMKDTQMLLAGNTRPALKVDAVPGFMILAVNRTTGQVNSSHGDLSLRGVSATDQVDIYAVQRANKTYNVPKGVLVLEKDDAYLFGALALAYTSTQDIRSAKDVLFASGNKTLWEDHQSAITPSSLAAMMSDLSTWVRTGNNTNYEMGRNVRPKYNLFELAEIINGLPDRSLGLAKEAFYEKYRRRSLKRIPGTRNDDGTVTTPRAETKSRDGRVYIRSLEFNTSDASVQLETAEAVDLVVGGQVIREVKFVSLETLKDFRSYTLVSSGERNVEVLPLEVYNERAFDALTPFLIPSEASNFTPGKRVNIQLKKFRMDVDEVPTTDELLKELTGRMQSEAFVKALSAMQDKDEASPYSEEQIAALKDLHLSSALYFTPPTTYHFADREQAIAKGEIDSYTRFRVYFGTRDILNSKEFRSGNAFLQRAYGVTDANGKDVLKPKLDGYLKGDQYTAKPAGKTKDTAADVLMAGAFQEILQGPRLSNEDITALLAGHKKRVASANLTFRGLVMNIGCTGLLPADLEKSMTRYEPEAFATKFGVKLGKDEQEAIFFVADNGLVISVVPEAEWYTVS